MLNRNHKIMTFQGFDIKSLADMFSELDPNNRNPSDDSEDEEVSPSPAKSFGPGNIGAKKRDKGQDGGGDASTSSSKCGGSKGKKTEIWTETDVKKVTETKPTIPIPDDPRKTPKYEMYYRQSVTSEDVFLQMGYKTPGSASCENLVVEVHLPEEEDSSKIMLNLKEQAIDLRSPNYFLYLGLPHPIDTKAGNAKWDPDKEKLIVTLNLARELDPINF